MGSFRSASAHAEVQPGKLLGDEGCVHEYDRESCVINSREPDTFLRAAQLGVHFQSAYPAEAESPDT
jgi:hypothetical protein